MPLSWDFDEDSDCLVAKVRGEWHIQSGLQLIDEMARQCRERGSTRILCDLREVRGPLGEADRYLAGTRVAAALKTLKLAVVAAPDAVVTNFAVNVAERRGGRMFTTKSLEEARRWLFETDAQS